MSQDLYSDRKYNLVNIKSEAKAVYFKKEWNGKGSIYINVNNVIISSSINELRLDEFIG